jgi:hypothetical protein
VLQINTRMVNRGSLLEIDPWSGTYSAASPENNTNSKLAGKPYWMLHSTNWVVCRGSIRRVRFPHLQTDSSRSKSAKARLQQKIKPSAALKAQV